MSDDAEETRGQRIRRARTQQGLSQEALAERAGVAPNTVLAIEQDMRNSQPAKLAKVMAALGIDDEGDEYPLDVRMIGEYVMAYLAELSPDARLAWNRQFTRDVASGRRAGEGS